MVRNAARRSPLAATAAAAMVLTIVAACGSPATGSPAASGAAATSALPATSPAPASSAPPASPGTARPSATPVGSPDLPALYRAIEDQVIALRGLPAKQRLEPTVLDEAALRTRITAQYQQENPPDKVAASEITLKALGLLPATASLQQLNLDLLTSQVAGYYDPDAKALFVVSRSGQIGPTEKVTFAHEFDHALQDQNFGLKGLGTDQIGQGDRSLARLSLAEGDATLLMSTWALANLSQADIAEMANVDPQAQATLDAMPAILRDTLLFPYTSGLFFVEGMYATGGWSAVDAAYAHPPDTTEQVMHPQKYAAHEPAITVALDGAAVASSLGAGWSVGETDTLGEFQIGSWLRARGVPAAATANPDLPSADAAAAGWGGDRYVTLRGPGGSWAVAIVTAWDTPGDASEFGAAAREAIRGLAGSAAVIDVAGGVRVTVLVASDAATLAKLRPAVGP